MENISFSVAVKLYEEKHHIRELREGPSLQPSVQTDLPASLELDISMREPGSVEAAIAQLSIEAKRYQPSVIRILSFVGWCAAAILGRLFMQRWIPYLPLTRYFCWLSSMVTLHPCHAAQSSPTNGNRVAVTAPSREKRVGFSRKHACEHREEARIGSVTSSTTTGTQTACGYGVHVQEGNDQRTKRLTKRVAVSRYLVDSYVNNDAVCRIQLGLSLLSP